MRPIKIVLGLCLLVMGGWACTGETSGGCTKDTDCKGNRVCSSGQCVDKGSGGGGGSTDPGGGGSGGAATCDGQGDCQACFDCAAESNCSDTIVACANSVDCSGLLDCVSACAADDQSCQGDCYNSYPQSASDMLADAEVCLECECPIDCGTCSG